MVIYKTTNLLNNKIYIGQDKKNDPLNNGYLGSGKILLNAIKKYGKNCFKKEILECCDSLSELNEKEIYWIKKFNARNKKIGYNIVEGGGGTILKGGTYEEIYGKQRAKEIKQILSESHKGIRQSEEAKKKKSISCMGKNKGKKRSEEVKQHWSKVKKGKVRALESIEKMIKTNSEKSERRKLIYSLPQKLSNNKKYICKLFYPKTPNEIFLCISSNIRNRINSCFETKNQNPIALWVKKNKNQLPTIEIISIEVITELKEMRAHKRSYLELLKNQGFKPLNT